MRSPVLSFACGFALFGCAVQLPGCQNASPSALMGQDAMALLSPLMKEAAQSYVANIDALVTSVSKVQNLSDAAAVVPKVEPAVKDADKAYRTLSSATPEERQLLLEAFGPKFDSANSRFMSELSRVRGDRVWGHVVGTALDQVKLYK